jgi:hypothetical protein
VLLIDSLLLLLLSIFLDLIVLQLVEKLLRKTLHGLFCVLKPFLEGYCLSPIHAVASTLQQLTV